MSNFFMGMTEDDFRELLTPYQAPVMCANCGNDLPQDLSLYCNDCLDNSDNLPEMEND